MKIHLKFFSTLKDHFRTSERDIEISTPQEVRKIFSHLFENQEDVQKWTPFVRFAVNHEYVPAETVVYDGDEVAFIPPVSGG